MTAAVQDAVLPSINGISRASKSSPLGSPYSWSPVFDSEELVPKLRALLNEGTNTHTPCIWAKQAANCLHFCLHFFENCVALISMKFYVGQHCDPFSFRKNTTRHLVPLANCLKRSVRTFFMQLHKENPSLFSLFLPTSGSHWLSIQEPQGEAMQPWGKLSLPGESPGFWAARGSSPQLFNPREVKALIWTKDTRISSADEIWAPYAACTVVSDVNTSTILFQIT